MCFQPRAQSAAPNAGSVGSCDYWCKGKSVLHELCVQGRKRRVSDVCMGCQAMALQGAAQQWAGGAVCTAWCWWHLLGTPRLVCAHLPCTAPFLRTPSPISAFLPSLHKAAVEVPRFLKESLTVLFQSPKALLRDVIQPVLGGCTFQGWERCLHAGSSVVGK